MKVTDDSRVLAYVARSIARSKGETKKIYVWASLPEYFPNPLVYEDEVVRIMADSTYPSVDVEMLKPHHNPVLCVDKLGKIYRSHGESMYLEEHLQQLLVLEKPQKPVEIISFIEWWSDWFYNHTESYNGALGRQLAYLWPAIVKGNKIEVTSRAAIVRVLNYMGVPKDNHIWRYIDIGA